MKTCSDCGANLAPDQFHVKRSMPDGLQACCKECNSDRAIRKTYRKATQTPNGRIDLFRKRKQYARLIVYIDAALDGKLAARPPKTHSAETAEPLLHVNHSDLLWHTIGMKRSNYRNALAWWLNNDNHRNHYCAPTGLIPLAITEMVGLGLMKNGRYINDDRGVYFHATPEGITLAKREFTRIRRVMAASDPKRKAKT